MARHRGRGRGYLRGADRLGALLDLEAAGRPPGGLLAELKAGVTPRARQAAAAARRRAEAVTRWTSGRR